MLFLLNEKFMNKLMNYYLIVIVLSISACATMPKGESWESLSYSDRMSEFENTTCCVTIDKTKVDKIKVGENISFSMSENDSLLKSKTGSEIYKMIEIPNSDEVLYFALRTLTIKESENPLRYTFLPKVTILNSDYTISRKSSIGDLLYEHSNIWGVKENFFLFIKIDKSKNKKEKYILIHEESSLVSKTFRFSEAESSWNMVVPMGNMMTSQPIRQGGREFDINVLPSGILGLESITGAMNIPFDNFIFF
jgi:hypothetical protein